MCAGARLTTISKQCGTALPMAKRHYAGVIENWDGTYAAAGHEVCGACSQ